jgi:hypothetical protein
LFVALSAGLTEELIFRGYMLHQFALLARSEKTGLLVQAVLFALAHGSGQTFAGILVLRQNQRRNNVTEWTTELSSPKHGRQAMLLISKADRILARDRRLEGVSTGSGPVQFVIAHAD